MRASPALAAWLLLCLAALAPCPALSDSRTPSGGSGAINAEPVFCVVVRTYWGHAGDDGGGLRHLLRSLRRQNIQSWEAVLLVLDSKPFAELHAIVDEFQDDRIHVFAEWVGPQFAPKDARGAWSQGYHGTLYNLTDDAIAVCPPETDWLIVTNGDNEYAEGFFQKVADVGAGADIVAFDFYSRFQRPTAPPCERYAAAPPPAPLCKRNRLRWCHTDLGANALRFPRFLEEGRRFGAPLGADSSLQAEHFDGLMAGALASASWSVRHVEDACLFVHAPSLQSCAWSGGVWDDRDVVGTAGGRCLSPEEAAQALAADPDAEEVVIQASSDGRVAAFEGASQTAADAARCLRHAEPRRAADLSATRGFFGWLCSDAADGPAMQRWLAERRAAAAAARAAAAAEEEAGGPSRREAFEPADAMEVPPVEAWEAEAAAMQAQWSQAAAEELPAGQPPPDGAPPDGAPPERQHKAAPQPQGEPAPAAAAQRERALGSLDALRASQPFPGATAAAGGAHIPEYRERFQAEAAVPGAAEA